jgi:hypothetical protein
MQAPARRAAIDAADAAARPRGASAAVRACLRLARVLCLAVGLGLGHAGATLAAGLPTFTITFKPDGTFEPARLQVPAGRFKLILVNASKVPVEFESLPLRVEKVLGPGVTSFVVITLSRPGEYPFFDDFHQNVKGTLVVVPAK